MTFLFSQRLLMAFVFIWIFNYEGLKFYSSFYTKEFLPKNIKKTYVHIILMPKPLIRRKKYISLLNILKNHGFSVEDPLIQCIMHLDCSEQEWIISILNNSEKFNFNIKYFIYYVFLLCFVIFMFFKHTKIYFVYCEIIIIISYIKKIYRHWNWITEFQKFLFYM